jgi:hypothetical protein
VSDRIIEYVPETTLGTGKKTFTATPIICVKSVERKLYATENKLDF